MEVMVSVRFVESALVFSISLLVGLIELGAGHWPCVDPAILRRPYLTPPPPNVCKWAEFD